MGAQRKGVSDPLPSAHSYASHLEGALALPFPMALDTPLPKDFKNALDWISSTPLSAISSYWDSQLLALKDLSTNPICSSDSWYNLRERSFSQAPRSLNIALLAQLADYCEMGGLDWLSGYINGFPITGTICQSGVFPPTLKPDNPNPLKRTDLFINAIPRFKARAHRKPPHADTLWAEALSQVSAGWLDSPQLLDNSGRFAHSPQTPIVNAFRFAVIQGDKIRACDDLKASLTNRSCMVLTPISLPSWEHIAQACLDIAQSNCDWSLGKGDESDAYKKQPLANDDALLAVVTLMGPDGKWYGFIHRSQIFGSTASVIHYNTFSRLFSSLICRILGLPCLGYFGDFAFLAPQLIQDKALATFREFAQLVGTFLKDKKCSIGPSNTFLGLRGTMPSRSNGMKLTISIDEDKSIRWIKEISEIISAQSIAHCSLDKLIGKLSFAQTSVFGKFARTLAQPLYDKLHEIPYKAQIDESLITNLLWWKNALKSVHARIVTRRPAYPKFIIYTDASWSEKKGGLLAALLFDRNSGTLLEALSSPAPKELIDLFRSSSIIYGLELFALVASFVVWQDRLSGFQVTAFVDNDPSSNGVVKGSAQYPIAQNFIRRFWQLMLIRSISVWIERVPSPLNWADMPTRSVDLPLKNYTLKEFPQILELIKIFTSQWSDDHNMQLSYKRSY